MVHSSILCVGTVHSFQLKNSSTCVFPRILQPPTISFVDTHTVGKMTLIIPTRIALRYSIFGRSSTCPPLPCLQTNVNNNKLGGCDEYNLHDKYGDGENEKDSDDVGVFLSGQNRVELKEAHFEPSYSDVELNEDDFGASYYVSAHNEYAGEDYESDGDVSDNDLYVSDLSVFPVDELNVIGYGSSSSEFSAYDKSEDEDFNGYVSGQNLSASGDIRVCAVDNSNEDDSEILTEQYPRSSTADSLLSSANSSTIPVDYIDQCPKDIGSVKCGSATLTFPIRGSQEQTVWAAPVPSEQSVRAEPVSPDQTMSTSTLLTEIHSV